MFDKATKQKLRFQTTKGSLSTEDLWDLPLLANDGFDLDTLARAASKKVKETSEESFVKPVTISNATDTLKLEILKHIIAVKLEEKEAKEKAAETKAKKARIREIMAKKQDAALENKSLEELEKELESL